MTTAIIDYGMGNLGSVLKTFSDLSPETRLVTRPEDLASASRIVLPGVGGFSEGAASLHENGWTKALATEVMDRKKPFLGICLGMQLLADAGEEGSRSPGLGFIPGRVRHLSRLDCPHRIPHVGWNGIRQKSPSPLFSGIPDDTDFYFVHSFAFVTENPMHQTASVDYGADITAAVARDHIFGVQFHPEKSSRAGRYLIKNFLEFSPC